MTTLQWPRTLAGRLLVASSLLILVFLSLTAGALDLAFRESSDRAMRDLLRSRVLGLLAAAEVGDAGGIGMRGDLPDERFLRPGSGLYARFVEPDGEEAWASPSLVSDRLPTGAPVAPGEAVYDRMTGVDGTRLARLRFGIAWEIDDGSARPFTVSVAESLDAYAADLARFRWEIGTWFVGLGVALLAVQWWLLTFLLRPLKQAEGEIGEMEAGDRERLSDGYPAELAALTSRLNTLVAAERSRSARYRETLDNLAHSLKTPLAVVRAVLAGRPDTSPAVSDAVDRMDDIVAYQLARAAASGDQRLGAASVPIAPLARATADALAKVHAHQAIRWSVEVPEGLRYVGDRGDLAEMLGNLMDNAAKWARTRARVSAGRSAQGLSLAVEDDGPGLPENVESLLARGARGDTAAPGHGIGLAVVRDLVEDLEGRMTLGRSPALGGARIEIRLPAGRARGPA